MQAVLDKVWEHLLPAIQPEALPTNPQAYQELCDKLATLSLPLPQGQPSSALSEELSKKSSKLESNDLKLESVAIDFGNKRSTLIVCDERGEYQIQAGYARWLIGTTDLRGHGEEPVAASGAWTAEGTYEVRVCYYESEFCPIFRFHYTSDELQMEVEPNVSWGPTTVTIIPGHATSHLHNV